MIFLDMYLYCLWYSGSCQILLTSTYVCAMALKIEAYIIICRYFSLAVFFFLFLFVLTEYIYKYFCDFCALYLREKKRTDIKTTCYIFDFQIFIHEKRVIPYLLHFYFFLTQYQH